MDTIILVIQLALAVVLAIAGIGKLGDLDGSRRAMRDFGVPKQFAPALGTALPVVELALAALLLPSATSRWAALGATLLFLAFIAGIGWNLRQGRQPDCHCFGQIHSEPAGWPTMIRNLVLTAAALLVVSQGGVGPIEWAEGLSDVGQIAAAVALAILAVGAIQSWLLLQLSRQNSQLLDRFTSLATSMAPASEEPVPEHSDRQAPSFDLPSMDGGRISLQALLSQGHPALLVFTDPKCGPCNALLPDISEWQRRFESDLAVAMISWGSEDENRSKADEHGIATVGLQVERETYQAYEVNGTPSAVLVDSDGIIREPYATGRDSIRKLVSRATSGAGRGQADQRQPLNPGMEDPLDPASYFHLPAGPEIGTSGSRVPLPAVNGGYLGIDDFAGDDTIMVFWNTTCGFCQRMLPDLKEWENEAGSLVDRVLVVSMGTPDEIKDQALRSQVVIDDGFVTARSYGSTGTPSAIRLDAEGKVASALVVGADAVLDMLYEWSDPVGAGGNDDVDSGQQGIQVAVASGFDEPSSGSGGSQAQ